TLVSPRSAVLLTGDNGRPSPATPRQKPGTAPWEPGFPTYPRPKPTTRFHAAFQELGLFDSAPSAFKVGGAVVEDPVTIFAAGKQGCSSGTVCSMEPRKPNLLRKAFKADSGTLNTMLTSGCTGLTVTVDSNGGGRSCVAADRTMADPWPSSGTVSMKCRHRSSMVTPAIGALVSRPWSWRSSSK